MELDQLLDQLKDLRDRATLARDTKRKIIENAQATDVYVSADQLQQEAEEKITRLEATIRQQALDLHALSAELPERVKVKMFTVVNEYDTKTAREWCFMNYRPALSLDTKTFEMAVKHGDVPDEIATVREEPRAQISTKL